MKSEDLFRTKLKFIELSDSIYLQIRKRNSSSIWVRSGKPSRKDTMRWTFGTLLLATQNAVSTENNDMDRIKTRRHFEMLRRGPNETPLMFKDRFKKALSAMEQLGEDMAGITDLTLS